MGPLGEGLAKVRLSLENLDWTAGSAPARKFGVDRFRTLTRQDIDARFQEFRDFTEF